LDQITYEMEKTPLSKDFLDDVQFKKIPELEKEMKECKKAQASWLKAAGLVAGAATAVITLILNPAPVITVAAIGSGMGLFSANVVPCLEWLKDWRDGKKSAKESGLHYLMKFKE